MRLQFRNAGQAACYCKIIRRVIDDAGEGREGARMGKQRSRNAIYRGFGYSNFAEFESTFVPNALVTAWFHSEELLTKALSQAVTACIAEANKDGFEFRDSSEYLTKMAVSMAIGSNEQSLQNLLDDMKKVQDN